MTVTLPNTIQNGDNIDATPVQGNFDYIENELNNQDTRLTTAESDIDTLQAEVGGWKAAPELTYSVSGTDATASTFVVTASGDVRDKFHPGTRVKDEQSQAISNYWTFDTNNADSKGSATMANIGTPTYTAGKFGNALTLNGTNQALSITDAAAFHLGASGAEFTIGVWFKTSNTGARKFIYQSFSRVSSPYYGITFEVTAANVIAAQTIPGAAAGTVITGTTTVTDGNWHYAVWTFRNNYGQLYLDGKLEASGYMPTPVFNATTHTRIGVLTEDGSTNASWFNGQIDDLFLINGYALDEQTIAAKYAAQTAQGTGDLTLTKYFLVTKSEYANPTTTVTLYGGTDHTLVNSAISNAYYSTQKAPYGFPLGQEKWSVSFWLTADASQLNPVQGTWYNIGGSLSVPIGRWLLGYSAIAYVNDASVPGFITTTLSTSNNSETDNKFRASIYGKEVIGTIVRFIPTTVNTKTVYYLNTSSSSAGLDQFTLYSGANPNIGRTYISATSTLL